MSDFSGLSRDVIDSNRRELIKGKWSEAELKIVRVYLERRLRKELSRYRACIELKKLLDRGYISIYDKLTKMEKQAKDAPPSNHPKRRRSDS